MRRSPAVLGTLPLLMALAFGCASVLGYENDYSLLDASADGSTGGTGDGSALDGQGGSAGTTDSDAEAQAGSGGAAEGGAGGAQAGAAGAAEDASTDEASSDDASSEEAGDTGAPLVVQGHVLDPYLQPVAAAKLRIGSQEAVSGPDGAFQLPADSEPYDLKVLAIRDGRSYGFAILGMQGTSPVVQLPLLPKLTPKAAKLNALLAWPDPAAAKALIWSDFEGVEPGDTDWINATSVQTSYSLQARWFGPPTTSANVRALQWVANGALPSHYTGWVSVPVAVTDQIEAQPALTPVASAVSDSTLQMDVALPSPSSTIALKSVYVDMDQGVVSPKLIHDTSASLSSQYVVPALTNAHFGACAQVRPPGSISPFLNYGLSCKRNLSAGKAVVLSPPAPPTVLSPANGQSGVTLTTDFTWTGAPNSLYVVTLTTLAGPVLTIVTSSTTARIPDLSDLGFPFPAKTGFMCVVWATTGSSIAAVMGPDGFITRVTDHSDARGPRTEGDSAVSDAVNITTE